jgi:hypothetical protein
MNPFIASKFYERVEKKQQIITTEKNGVITLHFLLLGVL